MPLLKGKSEIGHNVKEMERAGHPYRQALAAALRTALDMTTSQRTDVPPGWSAKDTVTAPNSGIPQGGLLRRPEITHAKAPPYAGSVNGGTMRADYAGRARDGVMNAGPFAAGDSRSASALWKGRRV